MYLNLPSCKIQQSFKAQRMCSLSTTFKKCSRKEAGAHYKTCVKTKVARRNHSSASELTSSSKSSSDIESSWRSLPSSMVHSGAPKGGGGLGGLEPPPPPRGSPKKRTKRRRKKRWEREGEEEKSCKCFFPALFILCHWNFFLLSGKIILLWCLMKSHYNLINQKRITAPNLKPTYDQKFGTFFVCLFVFSLA